MNKSRPVSNTNVLYFGTLGLVTGIFNGKEHYIPWREVGRIHTRLVEGYDYASASLSYPINRKEAAFILTVYMSYSGVKLSVKELEPINERYGRVRYSTEEDIPYIIQKN